MVDLMYHCVVMYNLIPLDIFRCEYTYITGHVQQCDEGRLSALSVCDNDDEVYGVATMKKKLLK